MSVLDSISGLLTWPLRVAGQAVDGVAAAYSWLLSTPPGRLLEQWTPFQYVMGQLWTVCAVFFQRLTMQDLGHIDFIGGNVKGMTIIVTGPTSGIGKETAAALARRGASVVLACRNVAKGRDLREELERSCAARGFHKPHLEVRELDLTSLESVRGFYKAWEAEGRAAHVLVNNAGIYALGGPREVTPNEFEAHMGANHLGHFLLTLGLLPSLQRGAAQQPDWGARIVNVSSSVHMAASAGIRRSDPHLAKPGAYTSELAYAQSKLAQILFARELQRRLGGAKSPIQVLALHPGMVLTEVTRTLPKAIQTLQRIVLGQLLLSPAEGARASVYCATAPEAPAAARATQGFVNADCRPIQPSYAARSEEAARWCWDWSAEQVSLPAALNLPPAQKQ